MSLPNRGDYARLQQQEKEEEMYNGYANQDEFHKALAKGFDEYAKAYEKGMRENPEGWRHASCDHANGYCAG